MPRPFGSVRQSAKNTALRALRAAGVYRLAGDSSFRKQSLLILCYHGLSLRDEHEWHGHLYMTPERFRSRLKSLRDLRANVLPLGEALQRLRAGTLPERSVALTFDDGFVDFREHAVPLLNEFGVPCTLYLTTFYSGLRMPIITLILSYLIWKSNQSSICLPDFGIHGEPSRTHAERTRIVMRLLQELESDHLTTEAKNEKASMIAKEWGIDYDDLMKARLFQIMRPDEVADCHAAGIDIQLHTHRHRTPQDRDLFIREIDENRASIRAMTGTDPVHFCYPSGVHAAQFLPWLQECGVQSATTCDRGFARRGHDALLLPRVLDDSAMHPVQFEAFVLGVFR